MSNKVDLYLIAFGTVLHLHEIEENFYMNSSGWIVQLVELIPTNANFADRSRVWAEVRLYPDIDRLAYEEICFYESEFMLGTSLVYMDQGGYRYVVLV